MPDLCSVRSPKDLNRVIWCHWVEYRNHHSSSPKHPTSCPSSFISLFASMKNSLFASRIDSWNVDVCFVSSGNPSWFLESIFCWSSGFWLLPRTYWRTGAWNLLWAVLMVANQKKTSPVHASDQSIEAGKELRILWLLQWLFSLNSCAAGS